MIKLDMSKKKFKFEFSRYIVKATLDAMETIESIKKEDDKYKILDLFDNIGQSMALILEEFIKEPNEDVRYEAMDELEKKIKEMDKDEQLEQKLEEFDPTNYYRGKVKPEA